MKKILITISITFSSFILLPSIANAALCTGIWEVHQANIDYVHSIGTLGCDGDPACLTEVELVHNTASFANDLGWAGCCASLGWVFC